MKGRLEDMAVADLIQHTCQDHKTARVQLKNGRERGELFFKNGNVVHASLDDQTGEQAVYKLMNWEAGTFELFDKVDPPEITITRNWTSLLLEAARLTDEGEQNGADAALADGVAGGPRLLKRLARCADRSIRVNVALGRPHPRPHTVERPADLGEAARDVAER